MRELVFTAQASEDFKGLDRPTKVRIAAALQRLAESGAGSIKKLQGIEPPEYRLRVGDWRVRFSYPDIRTIRVNRVVNRKDAYR